MATHLAVGAPQAIILQSAGLFAANTQRNTILNRLTGKLPQQADAENSLRRQSSNEYPVVRCMDLTKVAGEEITFDLINPMGGKPIMGSAMAEGRGRAMNFSQDSLRINQSRYPISAGDTMTQQRTVHELRSLARSLGQRYMDNLSDQTVLVHMAGARGMHDNIEWAVPLASDADFASIMVNPVLAPTKNRHFTGNGSGIQSVTDAGASVLDIGTTDVMNMDTVDAIRTYLDSMPLPPPPVIFEGDKMANDSPLRVLLVSSEQYTSFVQSGNFRVLQSQALARASQAGNNPLFAGDAGLWNGILIVKMPKPIRFYAGDAIKYCASYTSESESSLTVPSAFGTSYAVDRAILLGGQAVAEAFGKHRKTSAPYFWSEKELDHGDKLEVLVASINGRSKIRFEIDHGSLGKQFTDFGVMVFDTAVKIAGQ
jgi:N4-gp56 family major capsid protein